MSFSEWKHVTLADISQKITKGTTPSTIGSKFLDSGINFFRAECLNNSKCLDVSNVKFIDEETHNRMIRSHLRENDILFSMAGAYLGKTAIVTKKNVPANINQAIALIRLNSNLADYNYIYYYLNQSTIIKYINNSSSQSAQPNINLKQIGDLPILLPSVEEQLLISKQLSEIDEKIETNKHINENLQSISQLLFKHWFIDFEFPNEEGLPYKSSGGEMVDSELGMIPKGWEVKKLLNLVDMKNGVNYDRNQKGFEVKVINVRDFNSSLLVDNDKLDSVFLPEKQINDYLLQKFDTVIVRSAKPGETLLIPDDSTKVYSGFTIRIRALESMLKLYIFYYVRSSVRQLENSSNGTIFKNLNQQLLGNLNVVVPGMTIITKYNSILKPIIDKIIVTMTENNSLTNIRDTLLPKLMSGEIDLTNLEINK